MAWLLGLAIGALFGWFRGFSAGQRSVIIALPAEINPLP